MTPMRALRRARSLLVAKAIKLGERLNTPRRLLPKDAGDIFRLYDAYDVDEMSERMVQVSDDERSAAVTAVAIGYLRTLFATPRSAGIGLATDALSQIVDGDAVARVMVSYTLSVLERVDVGQ